MPVVAGLIVPQYFYSKLRVVDSLFQCSAMLLLASTELAKMAAIDSSSSAPST